MLRCKPPFFFIEAFGACDGIFESLPDGNLLILVFVGSRTLESLQEVVIKNDVVSLLAAARRGDDDAVLSGEFLDRGAAGRRAQHNYDAANRQGGEQLAIVIGRVIRTTDIELVNAVFAASVTDKEEEKRIRGFELLFERGKCFLNFGLRAFLIREHDDPVGGKSEFFDESFLCSLGPLVEFSFVLGAAGNTPDNQSTGIRQDRHRQEKNESGRKR